jgi:hypothetical protein
MVENKLLDIQRWNPGFRVTTVRLGQVMGPRLLVPLVPDWLLSLMDFVRVEEVAAVMIEEVVSRKRVTRTLGNRQIRKIAPIAVLRKMALVNNEEMKRRLMNSRSGGFVVPILID